ncbi:DUF2695 domain-containing protein [Nocardioides marmotae]|uniref:DUF2695 domain-containing protein n=1 Tax=Nocardioides marmotae TaxID=2663857 RepID=UPI0012B57C8F|nr:DUF2695 domain-containing protein [Nocardioides marmotae]MBC9734620.1 DUF2695 domain-containing protein [Nocardioides marmotae]MTB85722.1 DUF2695 domain-containing protein [Nocardioides marmotae]
MRAECLLCFTTRQVLTEGCDHSRRWLELFRELRSPTATGLEKRIATCDCATLDRWTLARHLLVRDVHTDELGPPPEAPRCAGVGPTSTRPCGNWDRVEVTR